MSKLETGRLASFKTLTKNPAESVLLPGSMSEIAVFDASILVDFLRTCLKTDVAS
jgi:hypothetical protein